MVTADDYVLGTHDDELARLGLQHQVWRRTVLDCWQRAGLTVGKRVLDLGAGPGFATMDLAEIVGTSGEVVAVERAEKYVEALRENCQRRRLRNIAIHRLDLEKEEFPGGNFDFVWCRWVLCFLSDAASVVRKISGALRPGGRVIFHEYADYTTWGFLPPRPRHREFVELVKQSWRASGGEPNIGRALPALLTKNNFRLQTVEPRIFAIGPRDFMWQWPTTFIDSGAARLQELGYMTALQAAQLRDEFHAAENESGVQMLTPLVLEVVAEKTNER